VARFPVPAWISTYSIAASPRSFGSLRANGRLHAGCDLYAPIGSSIVAIAKGKVASVGPFYWGTDAVVVNHLGYGVVRYGEVTVAPGIAPGVEVVEGQIIAFIAQLTNPNPANGNPHPMLHFELYSGNGTGPLSTGDSPYKRRADLKDPTGILGQLWTTA
jgi:murein DD-endopeptidase MepM/ murein hydrolase activator NlpD